MSIKNNLHKLSDQKVHEEQFITLTDITNLFFICESRGAHCGPGQQIHPTFRHVFEIVANIEIEGVTT